MTVIHRESQNLKMRNLSTELPAPARVYPSTVHTVLYWICTKSTFGHQHPCVACVFLRIF